jgi:oligopeptide transport system substrate-binding protein
VAMPEGHGYRLLFAHLKRDWRAIGVTAERVALDANADLRLVDAVAPANLSTWYLRRFSCDLSAICNREADVEMAAARLAPNPVERRQRLVEGDRLLAEAVPFIPLAAPVRWSLVAPRLAGFRTNMFGRHFVGGLVGKPGDSRFLSRR